MCVSSHNAMPGLSAVRPSTFPRRFAIRLDPFAAAPLKERTLLPD